VRAERIKHEFVEFIPEGLVQGTLYISIPYATATHLCLCGCGVRVVTPLTPTDWSLTFDGETVSLDPSIGNWNHQCQSHYWIRRSRVKLADRMSRREIERGRDRAHRAKQQHFSDTGSPTDDAGALGKVRGPLRRWLRRSRR
jgi:hypothetical protein